MIRIVHLLDDFAMGGVTRALSLFEDDRIAAMAQSRVVTMGKGVVAAPRLDCDLIVIHVPPCWSRLPHLAALKVRNPQARIVQVEHSYTRGFEVEKITSPVRFGALLRTAARLVNEIIAVSEAQRGWLEDRGVPVAKLRTIHPWSGREELLAVPDLPMRPTRPLRLLAYGRLAPEKNFAALIEAMDRLAPGLAELTLFGSGPEEARLTALASKRANVRLLPATNDIAPRLRDCVAVVVPSRFEAFGLVATEARMAGRPILVADVDGLSEQVRGGGIVAPMQNADEVARAIQLLFEADLPALGRGARASVLPQHDGIIARWQAVIRRAASQTSVEDAFDSSRLAGA